MTSTYEIPTRDGVVDLEKQVRDESGTMVERMMIVSKKTGTPIMKADFTKNGRRWLRRHVIPRQGHKIELDEDDILKATLHHETYTYNGTTLKGLGKYDDSRDYGISEVEEKKLVKVEVQRIINTITNDGPFLFSSNGVLSSTEKKSFEDVSNVIDQILCNFQIIKHDNARLLLEHCPSEMERGIKDFTRSRAQLYARYMQNQDQVEGYQPKTLQLPENNRLLYFQLVDYILGTMGRLLLRSAKGKFWESHIVSTLAMWATKLKNLSYDPALYASQSLSNGEDIISQTIAGVASKQAFILRIRTNSDGNEHKEFDALETEFNVKAQYYFEKMSFRYGMEGCLKSTALSLLNSENVSSHASCFQACSLVYRAGLEGQPTLLSSDRDGDVSASSDPTNLNCSYSAMELLLKNVTALVSLQNCTTQGTDLSSREDGPLDTRTSLEWEWSDGDPKRHTPNKTWKTAQMDHVVSLVVCNGLTTTYIASAIDRLIHIASNAAKEEDPIIQFESPPNEFQALFKITTAEYLRKSKLLDGLYFDADVKGVADSPMRRRVRAGENISELMLQNQLFDASTRSRSARILAQDMAAKNKMDIWVISEDSVIINCRGYVVINIVTALIIVLGAMAVPFAVKQRITGVDPFQITSFSWVVAAFIIILAKSRYVSQWPWHDFLRGRVVCNSVSDVHDVTGVDSQMIIWYLLYAEHDNILRTKGPFNGMFGQVSSTEGNSIQEIDAIKSMHNALFGRKGREIGGFAIDVPVDLSTMLASGFIIFKVLNDKGEHLICVDVRKGTEAAVYERIQKETFLSCMNIDKELNQAAAEIKLHGGEYTGVLTDGSKILKLSKNEFRWSKMLGLYIRDSKFG